MVDKIKKGLTAKDEGGVYIPKDQRAPYRPEYLHMSKADVVKAEVKRREIELKTKAYQKSLEVEEKPVKAEPKAEHVEPTVKHHNKK